jgi:glycosyltransferase involved in cell wall biosynthesis
MLSVEEYVHCTGVVPPEQVPELMSQIDIGLALDEGDRYNRVGNSYQKVSQYLAAGCLVVTKNCSDPDMLLLKGIRNVQTSEIDVLLACVEELLNLNLAQKRECKAQGLEFVETERNIVNLFIRRIRLHVDYAA